MFRVKTPWTTSTRRYWRRPSRLAESGFQVIPLKSPAEIEVMREAGRVVAGALDLAEREVRPGLSTAELDAMIEEFIRSQNAVPAFKNYHGFPASACI
ncbi:M24 family metallopeptidase, partial [candidate division GN15 bacterium]|nr:M24 family metallopeptidase [candidate division GN15 bacterium]